MDNLRKALYLYFTPKIGCKRASSIVRKGEWEKINFNDPSISQLVEEEIRKVKKFNISTVTILDEEYPPLLKEIPDPPVILYYKGNLDLDIPVGVVGTRNPTRYGISACQHLVKDLVNYNCEIISGFAYGIDLAAHEETLKQRGKTVAVLACGLDIKYPSSHAHLRSEIVKNGGCVLSEYPLGTLASPYHFPARNRIISGLSMGVLVVEGKRESGSLITAKCALEQGRTVYTVPGSIFEESFEGNHTLIREGGILVRSAEDILLDCAPSFLNFSKQHTPSKKGVETRYSEEENLILNFLSAEGASTDLLISKTGLGVPRILSLLTQLSIKGAVEERGGLYHKA
jgi:DNA processing protein